MRYEDRIRAEARQAALEEAAKVCEERGAFLRMHDSRAHASIGIEALQDMASELRALAERGGR